MNRSPFLFLAALALAPLGNLAAARADDPKAELNLAKNVKLLDTRFVPYGDAKRITREPQGFRFRLPALSKGLGQIGLYSLFQMAKDFEVSATFELIEVPPPQSGYGATIGIAIDTEGPGGSVALTRGYQIRNANGYFVQRKSADTAMEWQDVETVSCSTKAQKGVLTLRREKKEVVCLIAEGPGWELLELCRVPFTEGTVRKVRVYADSGGSPTSLDARLSSIKVQAEEITGSMPKSEETGGWSLWLVIFVLFMAGGAGYYIYRRRANREE